MKKEYCTGCGSVMVEKLSFSHYDSDTGRKKFTKKSICSKMKWYNFLFHTIYKHGGYVGRMGETWRDSYFEEDGTK